MILAKCCHDMDLYLWLANKECKSLSSFGSTHLFKSECAPEGCASRCLEGCAAKENGVSSPEDVCQFVKRSMGQKNFKFQVSRTESYTAEEGNLFFKHPVGWDPKVLVQGGVDIRVTMEERCFVDHVWLMQNADSELQSVEVFTVTDGEYQKIGCYQPESGKMICTSEIRVPVGYWCDNVVIRLNADCKPIHILKMDIWAAWELTHTLFP